MANGGQPAFVGLGIQNAEEIRRQFTGWVLKGEVFLMIAHHRDQHFLGQAEVFLFKASQKDTRPLRQVRHRVDQRRVFPPAEFGDGARRGIQLLANPLAPTLNIR